MGCEGRSWRKTQQGSQSSSETPPSPSESQLFGSDLQFSSLASKISSPDCFVQRSGWKVNSEPSKKTLPPKGLARLGWKNDLCSNNWQLLITESSATAWHCLFCQLFVVPAADSHTFPTVAAHLPLFWMVSFNQNVSYLVKKNTWKHVIAYIFLALSGYWWMPVHATVCPSERTDILKVCWIMYRLLSLISIILT